LFIKRLRLTPPVTSLVFGAFGAVNLPRTSQHKQLPRQAKSCHGARLGQKKNNLRIFQLGWAWPDSRATKAWSAYASAGTHAECVPLRWRILATYPVPFHYEEGRHGGWGSAELTPRQFFSKTGPTKLDRPGARLYRMRCRAYHKLRLRLSKDARKHIPIMRHHD
jgi:hypothetical protein